MVHIETGGAAQVRGEIEASNRLAPNGSEQTATSMTEIITETVRAELSTDFG